MRLLRPILVRWTVISDPRRKALSKATNRIGVSTWMGSSAIRRGGLPQALRVLLSRRFLDLRRCDLSGVTGPESAPAATTAAAQQPLQLFSSCIVSGLR